MKYLATITITDVTRSTHIFYFVYHHRSLNELELVFFLLVCCKIAAFGRKKNKKKEGKGEESVIGAVRPRSNFFQVLLARCVRGIGQYILKME